MNDNNFWVGVISGGAIGSLLTTVLKEVVDYFKEKTRHKRELAKNRDNRMLDTAENVFDFLDQHTEFYEMALDNLEKLPKKVTFKSAEEWFHNFGNSLKSARKVIDKHKNEFAKMELYFKIRIDTPDDIDDAISSALEYMKIGSKKPKPEFDLDKLKEELENYEDRIEKVKDKIRKRLSIRT